MHDIDLSQRERQMLVDTCLIIFQMNVTRMLWSQHYKCREFHDDRLVVIVMAAAFCVLPVIFYSANRAYGARLNRRLAQREYSVNRYIESCISPTAILFYATEKRLRDVKPDGPSPSMSNMSS